MDIDGAWTVAHGARPLEAALRVFHNQEAEGKEASLALLVVEMKYAAGRFCGAKRSKLVVRVDEWGGVTTTAKGKRDVAEEKALETARSLGANQSVTVLYCVGHGDDLVATGTTVSRVV